MKIIQTREVILQKIELHKKHKLPFHLFTTTNSMEMLDNFGVTYIGSTSELSQQDLNFIQRVNANINQKIEEGIIDKLAKIEKKLPMCLIGFNKNKYVESVTEIDINHAYWRSAYLLGIIDDHIYRLPFSKREIRLTEKGARLMKVSHNPTKYYTLVSQSNSGVIARISGSECHVPNGYFDLKYRPSKGVRLMALGTQAKKTQCFYFDGEVMHNRCLSQSNKDGIVVWEAICYKVHELMHRIMNSLEKDKFLLFWVDALIISKECKEQVVQMIEAEKFKCKEKLILSASLINGIVRIQDDLIEENDRVFRVGNGR